ncbi:MAG: AAA family ATPase, partial [Bacteroidota bacterium]|nr:AAA family ATPase [Bacteroidota bacterium]
MTGHDSASNRRIQDAATLKGVLRAVLFSRPDTLFLVGKFEVEGELFPIVATGEMASPVVGEEYILTGEWVEHPRYGKQFRWSRYEIAYPSTEEGIERYLASGMVRGIGAATARRIVERFGRETIDVLNRDIDRLLEVEGVGPKKLATIRASWAEQQGAAALMVFLKSHGIGTANALAIHRVYGSAAIDRVRENPYRLVDDVDGIGFPTADKIARSLGIGAEDEKRLQAGVVYTVAEAARTHGHTHLPEDLCVHAAAALLEADEQVIRAALRSAVEEGKLSRVGDRVSLPELHAAERTVVESLRRLTSKGPLETDHFRIEDILRKLERSMGIAFTPVQVEAVHKSLAGPVTILTGGPGTGKTTAVAGMVAVASELGLETALCAPTGRAAKRLSEITGVQARTIHRLLEYDPVTAQFQRDGGRPLEIDLLIADETSMVDLPLMAALLRAVPEGARVTLLGDADQLPSVGPGNVLRDMIDAGCVETVVLRLIHRQSEQSRIVTNAHRVREGFLPVFGGDTFFLDADTPDKYGAALGKTTRLRFTTGDLEPYAALDTGGNVGTFNAYTDTVVYVSYRNVSRL